MKRPFFYVLNIVLIIIFLTGCNQDQKNPDQGKAELVTAPDFTLVDLHGDTLRLSDYQGKIVILDFWDTWCPPCLKEIPDFVELYNKYQDQDFVIIGLAFGREGKERVESFAKEQGIQYPLAIANLTVLNAYGPIKGIPTTMIIDQNGKIINRYIGFREKEIFESEIQALLDKQL